MNTHVHVCSMSCMWVCLLLPLTQVTAYAPSLSVFMGTHAHKCEGAGCGPAGLSEHVCRPTLSRGWSSLAAGSKLSAYGCFCRFQSSGLGRLCGRRTALPEAVGLGDPHQGPHIFSSNSHPGQGLPRPQNTCFLPVPWHQSRLRRRSQNPLLAGGGEAPKELE